MVVRLSSPRFARCSSPQASPTSRSWAYRRARIAGPARSGCTSAGRTPPSIPGSGSPALRLVQRIRDEAHRFAIAGHRRKRARRFNESILETVPGLGPAKRRALLRHFGGLQGVLRAGVADLELAEGIGATMARTLYDHLHPGE